MFLFLIVVLLQAGANKLVIPDKPA